MTDQGPPKDPAAVAMGRKGGQAHAAAVRAGTAPITGFATPKPTPCPKCKELQPTHTAAQAHCRKPRTTPAIEDLSQIEIKAELGKHGLVGGSCARFLKACRKEVPDCSTEEVLETIRYKAKSLKNAEDPLAVLLTQVPRLLRDAVARIRRGVRQYEPAVEYTPEELEAANAEADRQIIEEYERREHAEAAR